MNSSMLVLHANPFYRYGLTSVGQTKARELLNKIDTIRSKTNKVKVRADIVPILLKPLSVGFAPADPLFALTFPQ